MEKKLECAVEIRKITNTYSKSKRDRSTYIETHDSEQMSEGRDIIEETEQRYQRPRVRGKCKGMKHMASVEESRWVS